MTTEPQICAACGSAAAADASFCSRCGSRLDRDLPDAAYEEAPPRLFGVLAPGPTLILGCVLLLAGLVVLLAGSPIAAIVLVAFAAATFVLFYGAAERDPASPVARRTMTSGRRVRSWALFVRESSRAWATAVRDLAKLRSESRSLRRERDRALLALGDAAYREDAEATEALRLRLRELDEGLVARDQARAATVARAREHVSEERAAVQPTQQFSVKDLTSGGNAEE